MMARRSGGTHKGVEEKRRSLPIYDHYTLSPGKTKSHHPEAKCNHCHKEFVCGSKQRLIRHLRKCNNITNPEHIIAETLNTLARNSATGQLNHSILEASNLLPSQIHRNHHQQAQHLSPSASITTANNSATLNTNNNNNNNGNHNTSGSSSNDTGLIALTSSNGSSHAHPHLVNAMSIPIARKSKRGRRPANQLLASSNAGIHVSTGSDGKTHFTPTSQLPPNINATNNSTPVMISQVQPPGNGRHSTGSSITTANQGVAINSGHLTGSITTNHHHSNLQVGFKTNSDPIDKAYLRLVLTRNLPLSLCDTKEFQTWLKTLANDYKPPISMNLIAQNLKTEAQNARQRISNILAKAFKKTINLELHCWPDDERGHHWWALIANIDSKRFLVTVRDIKPTSISIINMNNKTTISMDSQEHQDTTTTDEEPDTSTIDANQNELGQSIDPLSSFLNECIKRVGSDRINSLIFSQTNDLTIRTRQTLYSTNPSIVTYQCWWHFTNLLCSDIIEHNELFKNVLRNSNRLVNFINKRPKLYQCLERYKPFICVGSSHVKSKTDRRWYSHLICYLLEYVKNNSAAISRALEVYSTILATTTATTSTTTTTEQSHISSDNNNNSSGNNVNQHNISTQQHHNNISCPEDTQLNEIKSILMSADYWANLDSALGYLKPYHDILALTSNISTQTNHINNGQINNIKTPAASSTIPNTLLLSEYMNWFLNYGKTLIESWRSNPDITKYRLIERYLNRFTNCLADFKLLFAAYLLNPKYRCAYMTQAAKDIAIEEILNIASEFMPEESDGHTIFDQWRLYLVRDEPYDVTYEENRTTAFEWWQSLPCAESIRRVAVRILRLRAFSSPKPESIFSQLYFYEDETFATINETSFEDIAVLRYFYDFEDKIGQINHGFLHTHAASTNSTISLNGYHDRTQVGQLHNESSNLANFNTSYLTGENSTTHPAESVNQIETVTTEPSVINERSEEEGQHYISSFANVMVDGYATQHHSSQRTDVLSEVSIENLHNFSIFSQYIDFNESGVQIVEEPIEKKKRKWTAQEILSKCQSNHQSNNIIVNK